MKRRITKVLAVLLMLCMLLPQTALAATTYYIEVSISGPDAAGDRRTVSAASSRYGTLNDYLAETVVRLIHSVRGEIETVFSGTGLRTAFEDGLDAFDGDWETYVNEHFSSVGGSDTFKTILRNKASRFSDLTVNTANQINYSGYIVVVTLRSYSTGSGSGDDGSSGSAAETVTNPDGSTTEIITKPDGTTTERITSRPSVDASGNTSQTTAETTTGKDGTTESKTETTMKPDGSGFSTTTSTATKPDGSVTESRTETTISRDGSTVSTTTATTTNRDGTVAESKTEAAASTVTNADGSTTETRRETTMTSAGDKIESTTVTTVNKDGSSAAVTTAAATDKAGTVTESKTETIVKADGSTKVTATATVTRADGITISSKTEAAASLSTNKATGTVTETRKEITTTSDGVKREGTTVTEIRKDGTVTSKETVNSSDSTGTTAAKTVILDAKGGIVTKVEASVSARAVTEAAKTGGAVTIPVEVAATRSAGTAPVVAVSVPESAGSVKVELPVRHVTPGTVAVIVKADGREEIVPTSAVTENGVVLTLEGNSTVKLVDNSRRFNDVSAGNVFYNEICSLSARGIMVGKTADNFDLYNSVTLDQVANVAGRIVGAVDVSDFAGGVAWGWSHGLKTGNTAAARGDVLKALYIAAGSPAVEDTGILARFQDASAIPADMRAIVAWAAQNGILKGGADGNANLGANVTRGQACALAGRTMGTLA